MHSERPPSRRRGQIAPFRNLTNVRGLLRAAVTTSLAQAFPHHLAGCYSAARYVNGSAP
jgi:hypothetical protein